MTDAAPGGAFAHLFRPVSATPGDLAEILGAFIHQIAELNCE
jgi:hypothetical protein